MKSSPDFRSWPAWLSQANAKARSISSRSIGSASSALCSCDDGEEVAQQGALLVRSARG